MRRFNLRGLSFGERNETRRRLFADVEPFSLGGVDYELEGGGVDLTLDASRVGQRLTLHGSGTATVIGPCQRCLDPARLEVAIRCDDYVAAGRSEGDDGYVDGYALDLQAWVRDAIAEALPPQVLCSDDCRGLCAVCGVNLNLAGTGHAH
ncbi:MAG TPA: DUF177 domain-containing protein [Thermoleophilia bacterium]|nr:DUF177 domain-containing protein [Thermoleophilia bacterium]